MTGAGRTRDRLHGPPARARVVLGDRDQQERDHQACQSARVELAEREAAVVERHRDGDEADRGEHDRHQHAQVERVHDRAAGSDPRAEDADDRGEDRDPAERERIEVELVGLELRSDEHRGDRGHRIRLEEVGRHARAVADVVADVVRDHRRVARVVLRDPGLDLAHEVGADVGGLRVDAAAESREDGDERAAESETDEVVDRRLGRVAERAGQHPVVARDAQEREPDDQQASDGACAERHLERRAQTLLRSLGRASVRAHRDVHADEARQRGKHGPDEETDGGAPAQIVVEAEDQERHDRDHGDRRVLALEVGLGPLLDRAPDLEHPLRPRRLLQQPPGQPNAKGDRDQRADDREAHGVLVEELHSAPWKSAHKVARRSARRAQVSITSSARGA